MEKAEEIRKMFKLHFELQVEVLGGGLRKNGGKPHQQLFV